MVSAVLICLVKYCDIKFENKLDQICQIKLKLKFSIHLKQRLKQGINLCRFRYLFKVSSADIGYWKTHTEVLRPNQAGNRVRKINRRAKLTSLEGEGGGGGRETPSLT